jgi:hypothetical protein
MKGRGCSRRAAGLRPRSGSGIDGAYSLQMEGCYGIVRLSDNVLAHPDKQDYMRKAKLHCVQVRS